MRVEKLGCDTMLSHIVQMVAAAQRSRGAHLAACGPCVDHDRRQARGPGRPVDQDGETPERMERVDTLVIDKTAH
jgi:cation transport ATPase